MAPAPRRRLRRLLPRAGAPYELFNVAVLVAVLAALWYVLTPVSQASGATLDDTLYAIVNPTMWGYLMLAAASLGIVCSFGNERALRLGYSTLATVTGFWSISLLIGAVVVLAGPGDDDPALKAIGVAVLYGAITRRLVAEVLRARQEAAPTQSGCGRAS